MTDFLVEHEAWERDIPQVAREAVLERDRGQCQVCGTIYDLQLHHWKHWRSQGGGHEPENLVALCWKCHAAIHRRDLEIQLYLINGRWCAFARWRRK